MYPGFIDITKNQNPDLCKCLSQTVLILFQLSKLARDLKPSDEFNISHQHTELRLLSSDIVKLNLDETKPAGNKQDKHKTSGPPPGERLEFDEDEDNPLGSNESPGGLDDETAQNPETSTQKPSELDTASDEHSPNDDSVRNNQESERSENVEEEGAGDEEDEFEGGLC